MNYVINEQRLQDILNVCSADCSIDDQRKQKVSEIIEDAWDDIYTVSPRVSFVVGIALLIFLICVECFFPKDENLRIEVYNFLVLLGGSLTAAAFSAGFSGTLNINIKWLQAGAAFGVFVLVFINSPFNIAGEQKGKQKLEVNLNQSMFSAAYASSESVEAIKGITTEEASLKQVDYIRVYYPRGVTGLDQVANRIKDEVNPIGDRVEVWWLGSWLSWFTNKAVYNKDKFWITITHRSSVSKKTMESVKDAIKNMRFRLDLEDIRITQDYIEPDIAIYVRMQK